MPPPPEPEPKELGIVKDWSLSKIYQMVKAMSTLTTKNKLKRAKALEEEYFNPEKTDIFTEDEAVYNASIIRKKIQKAGGNDN